MEKVVYSCIGKFLTDTGINNSFVETGIFGINVTQQALSGSQNNRAVTAYSLLHKALIRLRLHGFFSEKRTKPYDSHLVIIDMLKEYIVENNIEDARLVLALFNSVIE